jgi:hypothetical protein
VIRDDGSVALESELGGPNQDKLSRFGLFAYCCQRFI